MLRPQQYKIDKEKKAQALVKLKQDAWKDMNKKLYDFHTKFTDKMRFGATFNKTTTTSSNPDAISIDPGAIVPEGTHTFEINQLAETASVVGQVKGGERYPGSTPVATLMGGADIPAKLSMKVNGKSGKEELIEIDIKATDTLSEIATKMNEKLENTGFTARYDEANGSFFISSTATGSKQSIEFSQDAETGAELFKKMGLERSQPITGKDAKYTYNNSEKKFVSPTNNIEINGIKATLKAENVGKVVISAEPDTEGIYTWIKEFVTEYNSLIDDLNEKINAKPGKDIEPLTAEEREAMSDSEIKLWEEKLNSSLFYKDSQLTSFVDSARRILGQAFGEGKHKSLHSLGIVTGSWQEKGKLHIMGDEDDDIYSKEPNKLRTAIEENSKGVVDLMVKLGENLYAEHNTTLRSSNKLKSAMNFYHDKVMVDKVQTADKKIATLEERMYRMEKMQYAKFAAMEKMLSSLNNQSSWLSQQFGGM